MILIVGTTAAGGCGSDGGGPLNDDPSGNPAGNEDAYLIRDNGIRCVTFPCFSLEAVKVAGGATTSISDVDFSELDLSVEAVDALRDRIGSGAGVRGVGQIVTVPNAGPAGEGRTFVFTRLIED